MAADLREVAALLRDPAPPGGATAQPRARSRGGVAPATAAARDIAKGDWVEIATPKGRVRARAALNGTLAPDVVCGQHGWFEACEELDLPGRPPFGPDSANLNQVLSQTPSDPISGSSPLRAQVCEVTRLAVD